MKLLKLWLLIFVICAVAVTATAQRAPRRSPTYGGSRLVDEPQQGNRSGHHKTDDDPLTDPGNSQGSGTVKSDEDEPLCDPDDQPGQVGPPKGPDNDGCDVESIKREAEEAKREAERLKDALERERNARTDAERRAAQVERERITYRIHREYGRRFTSVRRAKASGSSRRLEAELKKLMAWRKAIDGDGQLKRVVSWWSQQRQKDLEEIIGAKKAIAWLKDAVGEDGNGDLPTMLDQWREVDQKGGSLTGLHNVIYDPKTGLAVRVNGLDTRMTEEELMTKAVAHKLDTTPEKLKKEYLAWLDEQKKPKQPLDLTWLWWVLGGIVALFLAYGLYRLFSGGGAPAPGPAPAPTPAPAPPAPGPAPAPAPAPLAAPPTITNLNPATGPVAGGTPVMIEGTDFNAPIVLFRKAGQPDVLAIALAFPNPDQITCQTPAFPVDGVWAVVVRNADGQEATAAIPFTVTP